MPLKSAYKLDVTNVPPNPAAMEPKQTKQLLHYQLYIVSPSLAILTHHNEGREYMFADRFRCETMYTFTQRVDPAIELESDPRRKLNMFTTRLEVKARVNILKSLSLMKGKVVAAAKQSLERSMEEPMEGLEEILQETLYQRLQHFIEPGHSNMLTRAQL